jgi:hypothetical protein
VYDSEDGGIPVDSFAIFIIILLADLKRGERSSTLGSCRKFKKKIETKPVGMPPSSESCAYSQKTFVLES